MLVVIEVKVMGQCDERVTEHRLVTYEGYHHWEVERKFKELGTQIANVVDPDGRDG